MLYCKLGPFFYSKQAHFEVVDSKQAGLFDIHSIQANSIGWKIGSIDSTEAMIYFVKTIAISSIEDYSHSIGAITMEVFKTNSKQAIFEINSKDMSKLKKRYFYLNRCCFAFNCKNWVRYFAKTFP